ncbi:MAG: hypothetical protein AAF558_06540 [Verrucomicrobiota bacterium]
MSQQMESPRQTAAKNRNTKVVTSMALVVSVVVHLSIFLLVGSVVIFEGAIPPNLFESLGGSVVADEVGAEEFEAPPMLEDEVEPEPIEIPVEDSLDFPDVELTTTSAASDIITTTAVNTAFTNPFSASGSAISDGPVVSGGKMPKMVPKSASKKGPGVARVANIFGRQVEAAKFGAILDISFSTHKTIDVAVAEINKGFPDAILVLAPGCGMLPKQKGEIVAGKEFEKNIKDYTYDGKDYKKGFYSAVFFPRLIANNRKFEKLWKDAKRDNRGYVLHIELPKKILNKDGSLGLISGTHHAFEFLKEQGCDVIYWMADFDDGINATTIKNLAKDLKRADIRVIQHDFNGGDQLTSGKNAANKKLLFEETGGDVIIGSGKN